MRFFVCVLMLFFLTAEAAAQETRATFQSGMTSTIADSGALTAGELRGEFTDLSDSVLFLNTDDSDDITEGSANLFLTTSERSKLTGVEASADVTDTANVTSAGALMDSEVSSLSGVKTLTVPDSTTISTFGASLIDDTNAATSRATLGLEATSTDNAVVRFDGTSGATQNSVMIINDNGDIAVTTSDSATNAVLQTWTSEASRTLELQQPSGVDNNDAFIFSTANAIAFEVDNVETLVANDTGGVDVANDLDVGGDITVTGTVDGRDIAADGTTLDGITGLSANAVLEVHLKAVDTASDEECLTYETTTGDFEWQACGSGGDVVDDTTPQLGGDLDVNSNSIVSASNGDIAITPNGTGDIVLDGVNWPQADGSDGDVLQTDGAGQASWATLLSSAIYDDGGDDNIIIDPTATSTIDDTADNGIIIGSNLNIGANADQVYVIGYSTDGTDSIDDGKTVAIGPNLSTDATNSVLIGSDMDLTGTGQEKSVLIGHDNNVLLQENAYHIGGNLSSTGCSGCGMWGDNITNNYDDSFVINGSGGSVSSPASNVFFAAGMYYKGAQVGTGSLPTCNGTNEGLLGYDTTKDRFTYCNSSEWVYTGAIDNEFTEITASGPDITSGHVDDGFGIIDVNRGTATTLTVQDDSDVDFPIGTVVVVTQSGAGQVTIGEDTSVTVNTPQTLKLRGQYSSGALIKTAANTWTLAGDLEESP